jgi:hypothetical protein
LIDIIGIRLVFGDECLLAKNPVPTVVGTGLFGSGQFWILEMGNWEIFFQ